METIQSLLQKLSITFTKTSETSTYPPTPKMPSSPQSTMVENVNMLIEPITTIAEIVASNVKTVRLQFTVHHKICWGLNTIKILIRFGLKGIYH